MKEKKEEDINLNNLGETQGFFLGFQKKILYLYYGNSKTSFGKTFLFLS
jgi:hypothetical protein